MLENDQLDEAPTANFDGTTLRMTKGNNEAEEIHTQDSSSDCPTINTNLPSIPFKNIDVHTFFSDRNEVVERAIKECHDVLYNDENDNIIGTWLLTEISLWDTEKERIVLLTKNALYTIKYDFISLKLLHFNRIALTNIDTIHDGVLEYPSKSIIPRLNGLAEGFSSMIHCTIRQQWSSLTSGADIKFESRHRNVSGIRIMWNKGKSLSFDKKWNPFAKQIPLITLISHPLYWHRGVNEEKCRFDVNGLHTALIEHLFNTCTFIKSPLIIENYLGIGALLHNRTSMGFFKVRGKISF